MRTNIHIFLKKYNIFNFAFQKLLNSSTILDIPFNLMWAALTFLSYMY
jgi:hypothetical protein